MKKYTIGIYFNEDLTKVAMILKNRPEWQNGLYNFPGGHIEEDESPADCVMREFKEECGVTIFKDDWWRIGLITNNGNYTVDIFTAIKKGYNGEIKTMEDQPVEWIDINNLPDNMVTNCKWLIWFAYNYNKQGKYDYLNFGTFNYYYL